MKGLTALVTGGSSGVGLATSRLLLAEGANVVIVGRDLQRLKEAGNELGFPDRLKTLVGDVSREGNANQVVGGALKAFGSLNILVNSAGVFRGGALIDANEEDFDYVLDTNLKGAWLMCKFAARALRDSGGGAIVNLSSILASRGVKTMPASAYSASKGGVVGLTKALAVELAPFKIRVNCVVPALINTPMLYALADKQGRERFLENMRKALPCARIGEPEDIARAIVFLCRPENDWITGAEMPVDGGRSVI